MDIRTQPRPHCCCLPIPTPPRPVGIFLTHRLRHGRPKRPAAASVHRCLLVAEVLTLILDFVRKLDQFTDGEYKSPRSSGKRTLAALARTCHALSAPALDALWMRLDSLDPLIKVLPRRMWAKNHYPFVVRMFMGDKQWSTFRKYAERVRSLRGSCWRVSATAQRNVITALTQYPKASLPLLPNLTELVWCELKMSDLTNPGRPFIKHFAGPFITTLSLTLAHWPSHVPSELVFLADLPNLCPNLTSFSAFFPRSSYNDCSREIGDIIGQWPHLRVLRSCALPQSAMDTVISRPTLDTLGIELNNSSTAIFTGSIPPHVHTWSLGGNSAALCLRYLHTIRGSPTNFSLRIGADDSTTGDLDALLAVLPVLLDKRRLRTLKIELTSSYWNTFASDSFFLSSSLLSSLASFPSLTELDVSTFCSAELDDKAYETWIANFKGLTSLKIGVGDVTRAKPIASVGAVLAVLRTCPMLQTLWFVFDGSLPMPSSTKVKGRGKAKNAGRGRTERKDADGNRNEWGVTNGYITRIRLGYSPIGEDEKKLAALARCLRTVMPRLENIRVDNFPSEMEMDVRWKRVQEMLLEK